MSHNRSDTPTMAIHKHVCVCVLRTITKKFVGLCLGPVCNPDITLQYCPQAVASVVLLTPSDGWHAPTVWHLAGLPKSENLECINRVGFKSRIFAYMSMYIYVHLWVYLHRSIKMRPPSVSPSLPFWDCLLQDWHRAPRVKARGQCMRQPGSHKQWSQDVSESRKLRPECRFKTTWKYGYFFLSGFAIVTSAGFAECHETHTK